MATKITVAELVAELGVKRDVKSFDKAETGLSKLSKAAKVMGGLFIGGIAARGFKNLIDLASEAEERQGKFEDIFKESSSTVTKSLEEVTKRTGIAGGTLQEFAANLGAIISPAVKNADVTAKMSAHMTELALDIASFNDLEPEVALEKLKAGLLGSTEPMDAVGVNLRAANLGLEEFAANMGKSVKELTMGDKMQARYAATVKQLQVQGALLNATKTSKGFANASRALGSQLTDLGAEIGKVLLPAAGELVANTLKMVLSIGKWVKANKDLLKSGAGRFFRVIGGIVEALTTKLGLLSTAILALGIAMKVMGVAGFKAWLLAFFPVVGIIALIAAIGTAIFLIVDDFMAMAAGGKSMTAAIIKGLGGLVDAFVAMGKSIVETVANAMGAAIDWFWNLPGELLDMLTTALEFWGNFFGGIIGLGDDMGTNLIKAFKKTFEDIGKFVGVAVEFWQKKIASLFGGIGEAAGKVAKLLGIGGDDEKGKEGTPKQGVLSRNIPGQRALPSPAALQSVKNQSLQSTTANLNTDAKINISVAPGANMSEVSEAAASGVRDALGQNNRRMASFSFVPGPA